MIVHALDVEQATPWGIYLPGHEVTPLQRPQNRASVVVCLDPPLHLTHICHTITVPTTALREETKDERMPPRITRRPSRVRPVQAETRPAPLDTTRATYPSDALEFPANAGTGESETRGEP